MESWKTTLYAGSLFIFCSLVHGHASEGEIDSEEKRYQVFTFDFKRVELPYIICLWVLIASLAKIGFHLYHKLPTIVPESCLLVVLGLVLGALLHFSHTATTSEYVLDSQVFFIYLLPPIIFDAGYFMPIRAFFDNLGSILLLAFVNTFLNTVLIGLSLWGISLLGWFGSPMSVLHCFIFSALISAVDPVAVLATFEEVHVNQMLYIIVFGESLLNDGVTVVLYHVFEGFIEIGDSNIIPIDIVAGAGSFIIVALGGTIIGILFGLFGGFITKYTEHVKVIEPLFVFVLGYLMYLTSEMMHLSGILALSFGGIVLRHYVEANVSKSTGTTIKYFMKMLANISETIIFMFLGLSTIVDTLDWNLSFIFFALLFCLVYRLLGVMTLTFFLNRRRLVKLTFTDQFIMAYGGLRGGIAFCLALSLDEELVPEKKLYITATIIIVFFTVFIQGISIKPAVNALKVKKQEEYEVTLNEKIHETFLDHVMAGVESLAAHSSHNLMRTRFRRFNHKYIKPILSREKPKAKVKKLIDVFHHVTEQDALKSAASVVSLTKLNGTNQVTMEVYAGDESKSALISNNSPRIAGTDVDQILRSRPPTWHMNRTYEVPEEPATDTDVRNRKVKMPGRRVVIKTDEDDDADNVTVNFGDQSTVKETMAEKVLPWKLGVDEVQGAREDNYEEDRPQVAHVPSWVNNLSYNHITETGSPYASPETTVIPPNNEKHKPISSVFPTGSQLPTPWKDHSGGDTPVVSPMVSDGGDRSHYMHSSHSSPPPEHHVISNLHSDGSTDPKPLRTLPGVASAPDLPRHWQPLATPKSLQQDNSLLDGMDFDEVSDRVNDWLISNQSEAFRTEDGKYEDEVDTRL